MGQRLAGDTPSSKRDRSPDFQSGACGSRKALHFSIDYLCRWLNYSFFGQARLGRAPRACGFRDPHAYMRICLRYPFRDKSFVREAWSIAQGMSNTLLQGALIAGAKPFYYLLLCSVERFNRLEICVSNFIVSHNFGLSLGPSFDSPFF